jgi:hypothetical protein
MLLGLHFYRQTDVEKVEKTLIFVDKKQAADFLATYLSQSEFMATSGSQIYEPRLFSSQIFVLQTT